MPAIPAAVVQPSVVRTPQSLMRWHRDNQPTPGPDEIEKCACRRLVILDVFQDIQGRNEVKGLRFIG